MEGGAGGGRDLVVHDSLNGGGGEEEKRAKGATDPSVLVEFAGIDEEGKWRLQQVLELWSQWYDTRASEIRGESSQRFEGKMGYVEGGTFAAHVDLPSKETAPVFSIDNSRAFNAEYETVHQDVPRYDRAQDVLPTKEHVRDVPPQFHTQARCFNCGSYSHIAKSCHRAPSLSTIAENLSKYEPIHTKRGGRGGRGGGRGGRDSSRDAFDTRRKDSRGRGMKRFYVDGAGEDRDGSRGKRPRDEQRDGDGFPRSKQLESQLPKAASSSLEKSNGYTISANTRAGDVDGKIAKEASPVPENECVESQNQDAPHPSEKETARDGVANRGSQHEGPTPVMKINENEAAGNPVEDAELIEEDELMYDSDSSDEVIIIRGVQAQPTAHAQSTAAIDTAKRPVDKKEGTKIKEDEDVVCAKDTTEGVNNSIAGGACEAGSGGAVVSTNEEKVAPVVEAIVLEKNAETPLIEIVPSAGAGVNNGISGVYQKEKGKEEAGTTPIRVASAIARKADREEGELDIEEGEIVETSLGPKRVSEPGLFFPVATPGRSPEGRKSRRRRGFNGQQFYRSHSQDAPPPNTLKPQMITALATLNKPKPLARDISGGNKPSSEMHASNVSARPRSRQMQMREAPKVEQGNSGPIVGLMKRPMRGTPPPPVLQPPHQMIPGQHSNGANNMNHQNSVQTMHAMQNNVSSGNAHSVIFGNPSHNCTPPAPRHLLPQQLTIPGAQQMTQKVIMQSGLVGQQHQPVLARNPQIVVTPPAQHAPQMLPSLQPNLQPNLRPNQHPHHAMISGHQFPGNLELLGQQHEHYSRVPAPIGMGAGLGHVTGYQLSNHNQQPRFVTRPMHAPQQQYTPQQQVVQLGNSMVVINTNGQQVVVKPAPR